MNRALALSLLALLAVGLAPRAAQAGEEVLRLAPGEQKVLSLPVIKTVSVADERVISVQAVSRRELLVIAKAEGRSSLLVFPKKGAAKSYLILVSELAPTQRLQEVQELLGDMEGVSVSQVGDKMVVDGEVLTPRDAARIAELKKLYPSVKFLVRVPGKRPKSP